MAMTLRLTEDETESLRGQAEREHRSMHEVVRLAVLDRVNRARRSQEIRDTTRFVMDRDTELLRRLAQ